MSKKALCKRLGIEGWETLDPVLLAALATEAPLLLVGAHGTAKSRAVEEIASALGQEFRHYNASLVNYDDLVGIPLPDESGSGLRFVGTPGAIWDAEFVLIDEISRCRVDLQNKFFPIVHERRVAGLRLEKLRHRWAAMNPPSPDVPDGTASTDAVYLGSEPLDPALCDRFPFVVRVPGWRDLSKAQRRRLIAGTDAVAGEDKPSAPSGWLPALVADVVARRSQLESIRPDRLVDYVAQLLAELEKAGLPQSPRRARMLFGAILAVHAAREVLGADAADLEESAHLTVRSALPQTATEMPPAPSIVLAAHRQAWEISGLNESSAWRVVLEQADPVERVLVGARLGLAEGELARLVTQALAAEKDEAGRVGLATVMFLAFRATHALTPAAWAPLATLSSRVLTPRRMSAAVSMGKDLETWREISRRVAEQYHPDDATSRLERGYLFGGYPDLWTRTNWEEALDRFRRDIERFGVAPLLGPAECAPEPEERTG